MVQRFSHEALRAAAEEKVTVFGAGATILHLLYHFLQVLYDLSTENVCRKRGGGAERCLMSCWLREIERMNTSADPRFGTRLMLILWHKYLATRSNPLQSLVFWKLVQEKKGGGVVKTTKRINWQSYSDSQIAERTLQKILSRTIKHANRTAYIPPF